MVTQQRRFGAMTAGKADARGRRKLDPLAALALRPGTGVLASPYEDTVRDIHAALSIADGSLVAVDRAGAGVFCASRPRVVLSAGARRRVEFVMARRGVVRRCLAGLKFPLAYRLGSAVADWRYGLLFAVALLLPGWQHLEAMLVTHTSVVETAALAYLLLLRRYLLQPGSGAHLRLGLCFGLALHAHPTAVVLLPLSALGAWRFASRACLARCSTCVCAPGALLPFIPYLCTVQRGWPDVGSTAAYVGQNVGLRQLIDAPALASAVFWSGPHTLIDALLPAGARAAAFAAWQLALAASAWRSRSAGGVAIAPAAR
jgi:hypothetical protein